MICPGCGSETNAGLRFCKNCGAEIKAAPPPPTGPPQPSQVSQPAAPQQPAGQAPSPPQQQPQQQAQGQGQVQGQPQSLPVYQPQRAPGGGSPTIIGILALVAGAGIAVSTFLAWLPAGILGYPIGLPGWDFIWNGIPGSSHNFLFSWGNGILFFSGFWSLLLGQLIILGAVPLLTGRRIGGRLTLIFGLLGTLFAATNIVVIYTKLGGDGGVSISPGIGLWLFVGLSVVALVLGLVGAWSSG